MKSHTKAKLDLDAAEETNQQLRLQLDRQKNDFNDHLARQKEKQSITERIGYIQFRKKK